MFYDYFLLDFGIDLRSYPVLSDQGKSLITLCNDMNITQIFCIWHLLHRHGYKQFSFELSLLMKAVTDTDLQVTKNILTQNFITISSNPVKLEKLNKSLIKIGLEFKDNELTEKNPKLFNQFSLIERVRLRMPSTTGMIESTHGHENAKLPCLNKYWTTILRIIRAMDAKVFNATSIVNRNADHQIALLRKRVKNIPTPDMETECEFYKTIPPNHCQCSETILANALFQMHFKCSHLLSKNVNTPITDMPKLIIGINQRVLLVNVHQSRKGIERTLTNQMDRKIEKISETIRKFSHSKRKNDIVNWVARQYRESSAFLSGYPIHYINLVSIGVDLFSK
jgi:hypothetical protein